MIMKATHLFWGLAVVSMTAIACSVQEPETPVMKVEEGQFLTFSASFADESSPTRTSIVVVDNETGAYENWWMPGDKINIFYGSTSGNGSQFVSAPDVSGTTTTFSGTIGSFFGGIGDDASETNYFWGTYPYSANNTCDGTSVTMTLPNVQEATVGSYDPASYLMVARSKGLDLYFKIVNSGVKFKVQETGLTQVKIIADGGEILAGTVRVTYGTDNKPIISEIISGGTNEITVTPAEGGAFIPDEWYYVNTLPIPTLTRGFSITYYQANGIPGTYHASITKFERTKYTRLENRDQNVVFSSPLEEIWYKTTDGSDLSWSSESHYPDTFITTPGASGWKVLKRVDGDDFYFIPDSMFEGQVRLTDVVIPSGSRNIPKYAFSGCIALKSVLIPESIGSIAVSSFSGCTALESIEFPEQWSLNNISGGSTAIFEGCSSLRSVTGGHTTPDGRGIIFNTKFTYLAGAGLSEYSVPEECNRIGDFALSGWPDLVSITIPEGVTVIEDGVFQNDSGLTAISLPSTVTEISSNIFSGCSGLEYVYLKSETPPQLHGPAQNTFSLVANCPIYVPYHSVDIYKNYCHDHLNAWPTDYEDRIQAKIFEIHYTTTDNQPIQLSSDNFFTSGDVKATQFGNTCTDGVGTLVFDNEIVRIGSGALSGISNLKAVTIPESVIVIDDDAFGNTPNLEHFDGKYATEDGRALISEAGYMLGFAPAGLTAYEIPVGVKSLASNIFQGAPLERIQIPRTLTELKGEQFKNCTQLKSIDIPLEVLTIGDRVLDGCTNLVEIRIHAPRPLNTFSSQAFDGSGSCVIVVPENNSLSLWKRVFGNRIVPETGVVYFKTSNNQAINFNDNGVQLGSYTIVSTGYDSSKDYGLIAFNNPLTYLMENLFQGEESLVEVEIPNKVQSLRANAFGGCTGLTSIQIPASVTQTATSDYPIASAFQGCMNLIEFRGRYASEDGRCLIIDGSLRAFLPKDLTSYSFPAGITDIYADILPDDNTSITNVILPEGIETIGNSFERFKGLRSVSLPESLEDIGGNAFKGVPLETVTIPSRVVNIGDNAFKSCPLQKVIVQGTSRRINLGAGAFDDTNACKIYIPTGSMSVFAIYWAAYENRLEEMGSTITFKTVKKYANVEDFKASPLGSAIPSGPESGVVSVGYDTATKTGAITFSSAVTSMPTFFRGSSDVSRIDIPDEITLFSGAPFQGMTRLSEIYSRYATTDHRGLVTRFHEFAGFAPSGLTTCIVPEDVQTIPEEVFQDADLAEITLPSTLKTIGESAFRRAKVYSITLPDALTTLGKSAFFGCPNLEYVKFGRNLKVISSGAFQQCGQLETIEFSTNSTVQEIQANAFDGCHDLTYIEGPMTSVRTIGYRAFSGTGITSINLSGVTTLGIEAFSGCAQLTSIGTLSSQLLEIPQKTFYNCPSLTVPTSFPGVRDIGEYAFFGDKLPSTMTISSWVESIGDSAFRNCTGLCDLLFSTRGSNNDLSLGERVFSQSDFRTVMMNGVVINNTTRGASLPGSIKVSLPAYSFEGCHELVSISLPSVNMICYAAFRDCRKLEALDLPSIVGFVSYQIVTGCTSLQSFRIRNSTDLVYTRSDGYGTGFDSDTVLGMENFTQSYWIYVPASLVDRYKEAVIWNKMKNHILSW